FMASPPSNGRKARRVPNLDAFSDRKDVVYVISVFNAIEESLTSLLVRVIGAPKEKERFLKDILFNNAILPFSAKVKLFLHLRAANNWPEINPGKFHRLMHIRNQFAHSQRSHRVTVAIDIKKGESHVVSEK